MRKQLSLIGLSEYGKVYLKNKETTMQQYNKFIVAGVAGVVAVLNSLFGDNSQTVSIVIAIATALGVYAVPNKSK